MNVIYHFFLKLCCFVKSVALIILPSNIAALGSIGRTEVNVGGEFFCASIKGSEYYLHSVIDYGCFFVH
jgi:hypothetical protein